MVLILAGGSTAHAQFMYRQVNLATLARRAAFILQGRVIEARYEAHPDYAHVPTVVVTLEVERVWRGAVGRRYTFRQFVPSPRVPVGKHGYGLGDRLVLFLPAPSQYGLSTPLGGEQGRFHVFRDLSGNSLVANEFNNAGLFRNFQEETAREGVSLSSAESRIASVVRGPMRLEDFVSLVKKLTLLPRSE